MRVISSLFPLLLAAFASGCTSVTVSQPFGQPATRQETAQLLGHWIAGDDQRSIATVVRDSKGDLQLGTMEWKEHENRFVVQQERLHLRRVGEMRLVFLEVRDEAKEGGPDAEEPRYAFARYEVAEPGELRLWWVHADHLKAAVKTGEVPGVFQEKERHVRIEGAPSELEAYFSKHAASCFEKKPFTDLHRAQ